MKKTTKYYFNGEEIQFGSTITDIKEVQNTTPGAKKTIMSVTYDFNKKTAPYLISEGKVKAKTFFDIPNDWEEYVFKYIKDACDNDLIYSNTVPRLLVHHPVVLTSVVLSELAQIMWEDTKEKIIQKCYTVSPIDGRITELNAVDITKNINFLFATKEEAIFAVNVVKPIFNAMNE